MKFRDINILTNKQNFLSEILLGELFTLFSLKYPEESNLRDKGFILSHRLRTLHCGCKGLLMEFQVSGLVTLIVRSDDDNGVCLCSTCCLLFFFSVFPTLHWTMSDIIMVAQSHTKSSLQTSRDENSTHNHQGYSNRPVFNVVLDFFSVDNHHSIPELANEKHK